jgi:tetratricopeptide (TPR) repeat protein
MILFTPLVELSLIKNLKPKNFKFYFLTFVFLLFPLFLYLYLPIRSLSNPLIDWGNAKDYTNVFYHILRKQYGSLSKLQRSFPLFLAQMKVFLKFVYTQFHPLLLIFIPFGIIALKRKINIFLFITLYLILSVGVILLLNFNITDELIEVVEVFFIPSHLILIIFIFFGVNLVFEKVKKIFLFLFFLFPIVIFTSNFFYSNRSRNFLAYDYGMNIISSINEKNAILFTKGDNQIFPLVYLFSVEEKGKELKIYDDYNFIFKGLYGENFNKLPEEEQNSKRYEIIRKVMNSTKLQIYYTAAAHISLFPEVKAISNGIIYKLMKEDSSYDMDQIIWRKYILREENFYKTYLSSNISAQYHYFLGKYYLRKKFLENAIHEFEKATLTGYAMESMYNNVAAEYFDMKEYDKALSLLKKAMSINPNKPEIYWNIGTVYLTKNDFDNAILYYEKAIKIKPTYADAYAKLGETYFRKKNIERAIFYTKKALEYNPTHQEAKENLKKFIKQ